MQRPKWLSGREKGKNSFEGSLIVDLPEIKVIEASFNKDLVFLALGTPQSNEKGILEKENTEVNIAKNRCNLDWKIFYDQTDIPPFITVDQAKALIAGVVAVTSGNSSVYNANTRYIASGSRKSKGNAPLLLDYELAKKIEEAKKE